MIIIVDHNHTLPLILGHEWWLYIFNCINRSESIIIHYDSHTRRKYVRNQATNRVLLLKMTKYSTYCT